MLSHNSASLQNINEISNVTLHNVVSASFNLCSDESAVTVMKDINKSIETLIRYLDANVNACNKDGWSVLEVAAGADKINNYKEVEKKYYLNEDSIETLLIYGAEWNRPKMNLLQERRTNIREIIVKYNTKRKLAGFKYRTEALIDIKDLQMENFIEQCLAEIEKMKTQRLFGNVTMYKFLRSPSKRSLVSAFKREEVKKIYKQESYETEYPIYKNVIEYNFIEGEKYENIYEKAYEDLNNLCDCRLPNIALDKIMDCIDKKDMDNLPREWRYEYIFG